LKLGSDESGRKRPLDRGNCIRELTPMTVAYIDGFNFYYGALKGTPYKWIDFEAVCAQVFPDSSVDKIRYFTAPVKPRRGDAGPVARQSAFLRAISVNPKIDIIKGHFRSDNRWLPVSPGSWAEKFRPQPRAVFAWRLAQRLAEPLLRHPLSVNVIKTEEKGSDVNLASHLLQDVFQNDCTQALVFTNDSDLATPIKMAVAQGAEVLVVNPHNKNKISGHLLKVASSTRQLRAAALAKAQLPSPVIGRRGKQIHKPREWRKTKAHPREGGPDLC